MTEANGAADLMTSNVNDLGEEFEVLNDLIEERLVQVAGPPEHEEGKPIRVNHRGDTKGIRIDHVRQCHWAVHVCDRGAFAVVPWIGPIHQS